MGSQAASIWAFFSQSSLVIKNQDVASNNFQKIYSKNGNPIVEQQFIISGKKLHARVALAFFL
jgi:hypothetical protein